MPRVTAAGSAVLRIVLASSAVTGAVRQAPEVANDFTSVANQVAVPLDGAAASHDPLAVPCMAARRACVSDLCASRHRLLTLSMTGQFLGHLGASRSALVLLLDCGMSRHPRSSTTVPLVGGEPQPSWTSPRSAPVNLGDELAITVGRRITPQLGRATASRPPLVTGASVKT